MSYRKVLENPNLVEVEAVRLPVPKEGIPGRAQDLDLVQEVGVDRIGREVEVRVPAPLQLVVLRNISKLLFIFFVIFANIVRSYAKTESRIDESNKGHQMLKKMGWSGATGLGATGQGIQGLHQLSCGFPII